MNFRDDHKPPLWMERSDHTWGTNLTYTDLALEDLDQPLSRSLLRAAADRASWTGARGVDTSVAPTSQAPASVPCPAGGPTLGSDR